MACRTMRSWQLRWRSFSYNWEESPIDSSCNCSISGANWAPYLKPEDVRMYIFSWKLSPAKIQLCPITEVLGRSESCQTTWHEQAPGVFFWDLNDLHSHRMKCHVAAGAKAKSFQRWILQKEGVRYKRKHVTNRRSFLFFLWQDPKRTSFKWQVFPSKLLPSKPEVKEESKARGKKNMAATMNSKNPVVDCCSQVKREDVKVKKEIKELPPQKIKTFRWGKPMVVEDVDFFHFLQHHLII